MKTFRNHLNKKLENKEFKQQYGEEKNKLKLTLQRENSSKNGKNEKV